MFEILFVAWVLSLVSLIAAALASYRYLGGGFLLAIFGLATIFALNYGIHELFRSSPQIESVQGISADGLLENPRWGGVVNFTRPIQGDNVTAYVDPGWEGEWQLVKADNWLAEYLPWKRALEFTPSVDARAGTDYQHYFVDARNLLQDYEPSDKILKFRTPDLSEMEVSVEIASDNAGPILKQKVDVDSYFRLDFSPEFLSYYAPQYSLKSERGELHPLTHLPDKGEMTMAAVNPARVLEYDTEYEFNVSLRDYASGIIEDFQTLKFRTSSQELVADIDSDSEQEKFRIKLTESIVKSDLTSRLTVTTKRISQRDNINYDYHWLAPDKLEVAVKDDRRQESDLAVGLTLEIKPGVRKLSGGVINDTPLYFSLTKYGELQVLQTVPAQQEMTAGIPKNIELVFSQPLTAEARIRIELAELNVGDDSQLQFRQTIQGQRLVIEPSEPLEYDAEYEVRLSRADFESGQFSFTFRTPPQTVRLQVPLLLQEEQFECNVTAAAMVLNFYGHKTSKEEIFAEIPKQSVDFDAGRNIWGDPNQGFVGDVTGRTKGYGVHWEPIARFIADYEEVEIKRDWNLEGLLREVQSGKPVIVWWQNGRSTPADISWRTPNGQRISAVNGMHSEIVVGYEGDITAPDIILINDPWRGERRLTVAEFIELWEYYQNTALVIG